MSADEQPGGNHSGYEKQDVAARPVAEFTLSLVLLMAFAMALMWGLFQWLDSRHRVAQPEPRPLAETLPAEPPEPRLQTNPTVDLTGLRAAEREGMATYGWVDRQAGIARIPVERAMEIVAEKGLPTRQEEKK